MELIEKRVPGRSKTHKDLKKEIIQTLDRFKMSNMLTAEVVDDDHLFLTTNDMRRTFQKEITDQELPYTVHLRAGRCYLEKM